MFSAKKYFLSKNGIEPGQQIKALENKTNIHRKFALFLVKGNNVANLIKFHRNLDTKVMKLGLV